MDYTLSPLPLFGVEVYGIDLQQPIPHSIVEKIKQDVTQHRLVVFRNQGVVSGERQVEISRWFGDELDSVFFKHPRSPHPDVFRVSNDPVEGCTGVGRTGWHIDGTFRECPYSHSLYHIESVPLEGDTAFVPLNELVHSLTKEQRAKWDRLYMCSDRREGYVHPLLCSHPLTGLQTLCFHLGMTKEYIWDYDDSSVCRTADPEECETIKQEIHNQIIREGQSHIYSHKWKEGDFIISDNLAIGHEATPETQLPVSTVGLRVMHRTTVKGTHKPTK